MSTKPQLYRGQVHNQITGRKRQWESALRAAERLMRRREIPDNCRLSVVFDSTNEEC